MHTISEITLPQINAALLSMKKDIESSNLNVLKLKKENDSLRVEIEKLKLENTVAEPSVVMMNDEEPTVEE